MDVKENTDGTLTFTLSSSEKDSLRKDNKDKTKTKPKTNKKGTGTYKEGAVSSDGADVNKAEKAFQRKKGKMSPEERKKVAARIASAKQQQGKKGTVPK